MEALRLGQKLKFAGCLSTGVSTKRVCRSLFGSATELERHQDQQSMQQEMESMIEDSSDRWNFDFRSFTPRSSESGIDWSPMATAECDTIVTGTSLIGAVRHPAAAQNISMDTPSSAMTLPLALPDVVASTAKPRTPSRKRRSPTPETRRQRTRSWSKIGVEDDVINIVTMSPNRPTQEEQTSLTEVATAPCRALDFEAPTKDSSTIGNLTLQKKRRRSSRIDDYMKQKKPRRSSIAVKLMPTKRMSAASITPATRTSSALLC